MSELSPSGGSEEYGACDDEVDVGDDGKVADLALVSHRKYLREESPPGAPQSGARRMARI